MRIRTRILVLIAITLSLSLGTMTVLAGYQIREAVILSVRRDQQRTASLVASSNILTSEVTVHYVSNFIGAEILSFDKQLGVLASSLSSEETKRWARRLLDQKLLSTKQTVVMEMTREERDWTAAVTPIDHSNHKIAVVALIYRGALIRTRFQSLIRPWLLSGALVTLLTIIATFFVSRSVVKPLEELAKKTENLEQFASNWQPDKASQTEVHEVQKLAQTLAETFQKYQHSQEKLAQSERLSALGQLSSALAHELRNPLASIRMILALEVEKLDQTPSELKQHPQNQSLKGLKLALQEIERLSMSTTKLLSFVREPQLHKRLFSVVEMVQGIGHLMCYQFDHLDIEFVVEGDPELKIEADFESTRHVVLNLVQNASQASQNGGTVRCVIGHAQVAMSCQGIQLQVIDEGIGIQEADKQRIFEPFFSSREGGTGLGLAISKAILDAHGAEIQIADNRIDGQKRGTIMTILWPQKTSDKASQSKSKRLKTRNDS